jgi:hypothetical protein
MAGILLNTRYLPSVAVAYSRCAVLSEMCQTKLVLTPLRIQRDMSSFAISHEQHAQMVNRKSCPSYSILHYTTYPHQNIISSHRLTE